MMNSKGIDKILESPITKARGGSYLDIEFIKSIKQDLDRLEQKETPTKVLLEAEGYSDGELVYDTAVCPNCNEHFEIDNISNYHKYCPECGQRLDWGDLDD